jgi:hypothetical protein
MKFNLRARLTAEFPGCGFLVAAAIGSGIMGKRLAGGNVAIALLANTIATGAALVALILTFGPISGAHPESSRYACRRNGPQRISIRSAIEREVGPPGCSGCSQP